jgi:hypothetical protein
VKQGWDGKGEDGRTVTQLWGEAEWKVQVTGVKLRKGLIDHCGVAGICDEVMAHIRSRLGCTLTPPL